MAEWYVFLGCKNSFLNIIYSRPTFQITLMMEGVSTSETSVQFNKTKRRYSPESCHLQCFHCTAILFLENYTSM
jgi:hypothetical protein